MNEIAFTFREALTGFGSNKVQTVSCKIYLYCGKFDSFPVLMDFSDEIGGDSNKFDIFGISYNEMCQRTSISQMTNMCSYIFMHGQKID